MSKLIGSNADIFSKILQIVVAILVIIGLVVGPYIAVTNAQSGMVKDIQTNKEDIIELKQSLKSLLENSAWVRGAMEARGWKPEEN